MSRLERYAIPIIVAAVGALIGLIGALYGMIEADAAVRVRPELENVGFLDAAFTDHGLDWLYYHFPIPMAIFSVFFVALVFLGFWKLK